jgi:cell wall-associated NlpC family hydrolase
MEKWEIAKDWCLQRVGNPYIYGATGQTCTPAYREARAKQYPSYDAKIRKNCPRLSGKASTCKDCKWADLDTGKGKLAYDCAQFTRWCMNAVGISLVSGANSQWQKTKWQEAGGIDTIPRDRMCLVYREDDDGKKHHTGVYLGDGYIVHAKGHDYGVVKELLGNPRFTHWGIPVGLYESAPEHKTIRKGDRGVLVSELQKLLNTYCYGLTVDGIFGNKTYNALRQFQASVGLTPDGVCGEKTWDALGVENKPADGVTDETENEPNDITNALAEARKRLYEAIAIINGIMEGDDDG